MAVSSHLISTGSALRKCTKCLQEKLADYSNFRAEKRTKIGLQSKCLDCEREHNRARRAADPDLDRRYYENNKEWLLPKMNKRKREKRSADPTPFLESNKRWRESHRDSIRAKYREFYKDNRLAERDRITSYYEENPQAWSERLEKIEAWRRRNRDKSRSYVRNRRAKINQSEGSHTGADIEKIFNGQKGFCWWCGKDMTDTGYHVDHRIPISRGGSNGPENLVISCPPCNLKKNDKMPWEMETPRLF